MPNLPTGWKMQSLGSMLRRRTERADGSEPLLSVTQKRGVIHQEEVGRRDSSSDQKESYWRVFPGDIVYNTMRMWQGVSGVSKFYGIVSPAYTVCRPLGGVDSEFLAFLFKRPSVINKFYRLSQGLVSDTWNLRYSAFSQIELPVPPLREQRRIAEILHAFDCQLKNTIALQKKLKVIEQGVLTESFSQIERSPDFWKFESVSNVGDIKLGRQRSPHYESGSHMVPYLRVANVFEDHIDYGDVLNTNFSPSEQAVYGLRRGDILLNEGQSIELVGRSAIFDGPPGMCFQNTLIRFRPRSVSSQYAQAVFRYWLKAGEFMKVAKRTTSIAHLGADRFARMRFPVPSPERERRVVNSLSAIKNRIEIEKERKRILERIKQGLADDLLTGRVRVRDAEALIENL